MNSFFKGVRKHIGKLSADALREQYKRVADEFDFFEKVLGAIKEGIVVLDGDGEVTYQNPFAVELLGKGGLKGLNINLGQSSKQELAVTYPE